MYFLILKIKQNLVISMFLSYSKEIWHLLKLVLHVMQVLKYGIMNLIVMIVIFGHLDVFYTKFVVLETLLEIKMQVKFTKK